MNEHRHFALCLFLFCLSFATRAPLIGNRFAIMTGDEGVYHQLANHLISGKGFTNPDGSPTAWRTPGFPLVLAGLYQVVGPHPSRARILLIILSSLISVVIYALAVLLFENVLAGALGGIGWAFLQTSWWMGDQFYGEELAAFVWTLGLCCVVISSNRRSLSLAIISGLLLALAALTRGFLLPALCAPLFWFLGQRQIKATLCFLLATSMPIAVWMGRNHKELGTFTFSTESPQVMWVGNNQWARGSWPGEWMLETSEQKRYLESRHPGFKQMGEVEQARVFSIEARNEVRAHPGHILWLLPRKLFLFLSPKNYFGTDWVYLAFAPFAMIGTWLVLRPRPLRLAATLLVIPLLAVAFVCLVTFGDARFRHPLDPTILVLAGLGVSALLSHLGLSPKVMVTR